jgi:hypothetical protein
MLMLRLEVGIHPYSIEERHRQDRGGGWSRSSESYRYQRSQEPGLGWAGRVVEVGIGARRLVVICCDG